MLQALEEGKRDEVLEALSKAKEQNEISLFAWGNALALISCHDMAQIINIGLTRDIATVSLVDPEDVKSTIGETNSIILKNTKLIILHNPTYFHEKLHDNMFFGSIQSFKNNLSEGLYNGLFFGKNDQNQLICILPTFEGLQRLYNGKSRNNLKLLPQDYLPSDVEVANLHLRKGHTPIAVLQDTEVIAGRHEGSLAILLHDLNHLNFRSYYTSDSMFENMQLARLPTMNLKNLFVKFYRKVEHQRSPDASSTFRDLTISPITLTDELLDRMIKVFTGRFIDMFPGMAEMSVKEKIEIAIDLPIYRFTGMPMPIITNEAKSLLASEIKFLYDKTYKPNASN